MDEHYNRRIAMRLFQAGRVFFVLGAVGALFLGGFLGNWIYAGILFGALGLLSLFFARGKPPSA